VGWGLAFGVGGLRGDEPPGHPALAHRSLGAVVPAGGERPPRPRAPGGLPIALAARRFLGSPAPAATARRLDAASA
jgi:hypothetical protein